MVRGHRVLGLRKIISSICQSYSMWLEDAEEHGQRTSKNSKNPLLITVIGSGYYVDVRY